MQRVNGRVWPTSGARPGATLARSRTAHIEVAMLASSPVGRARGFGGRGLRRQRPLERGAGPVRHRRGACAIRRRWPRTLPARRSAAVTTSVSPQSLWRRLQRLDQDLDLSTVRGRPRPRQVFQGGRWAPRCPPARQSPRRRVCRRRGTGDRSAGVRDLGPGVGGGSPRYGCAARPVDRAQNHLRQVDGADLALPSRIEPHVDQPAPVGDPDGHHLVRDAFVRSSSGAGATVLCGTAATPSSSSYLKRPIEFLPHGANWLNLNRSVHVDQVYLRFRHRRSPLS